MNHTAFLDAILTEPDDLTHRLVYADWLEEHGNESDRARAEFIRLQIELQRCSPGRRRQLVRRESELLTQHEAEWVGPVREVARRWRFHRGFIEEVTLSAREFQPRTEVVLRSVPLRRLRLRHSGSLPDHLGDLEGRAAAGRLVARLVALDLGHDFLRSEVAAFLFADRIPRLQRLDLGGVDLPGDGLDDWLASPALERLRALGLSYASGPILERVAASPLAGRLRELTVRQGQLGDNGLAPLLASPLLGNLTTLGLGHNSLTGPGIRRLIDSTATRGLERLDLGFNSLDPATLRALGNSSSLGRLTELNLSHAVLTPAHLRALLATPLPGRLRHLDLSLNHLVDEGAGLLADYSHPSRLETLDLIYNHFSERAQQALRQRFGAEVCLFNR